ncbi:hypothetical protein CYG49_00080 [Candidatus Saccharibacteria bacterium]|nr:MAG: hypothetical protein CYG49_00080 [Candidatus Saccharibacteria bacterium]
MAIEQEPLFEVPTLDTAGTAEQIASAALVARARRAESQASEEDATDHWLAETGGGGRRETLATNPPRAPKPPRPTRRRPGGPSRAYDDERHLAGTADPYPPVREVLDALTEQQQATTARGAALAREALSIALRKKSV